MKIERPDGTTIDIPNWLVVVLAFLLVAILVPAIAIISTTVIPVIFGG